MCNMQIYRTILNIRTMFAHIYKIFFLFDSEFGGSSYLLLFKTKNYTVYKRNFPNFLKYAN